VIGLLIDGFWNSTKNNYACWGVRNRSSTQRHHLISFQSIISAIIKSWYCWNIWKSRKRMEKSRYALYSNIFETQTVPLIPVFEIHSIRTLTLRWAIRLYLAITINWKNTVTATRCKKHTWISLPAEIRCTYEIGHIWLPIFWSVGCQYGQFLYIYA
jgi:hypothetical protein